MNLKQKALVVIMSIGISTAPAAAKQLTPLDVYEMFGTAYAASRLCGLNAPSEILATAARVTGLSTTDLEENSQIIMNNAMGAAREAQRKGVGVWCNQMSRVYSSVK